jgi:hypothetical protein
MGSAFNLEVIARSTPGTSGYYFARTSASGHRYVSLYKRSSSKTLVVFYSTGDRRRQHSLSVDFGAFDNGATHSVTMAVVANQLIVSVDAVGRSRLSVTATLDGIIDDCGAASPDCITYLGRRHQLGGGAGFPHNGCIFAAWLQPLPSPPPFNLLDPAVHAPRAGDSNGNDDDGTALAGTADPICHFDGDAEAAGVALSSFPSSPGGFTVAVEFAVTSAGSGYLVAKGAGGTSRFWSVYLRRSDGRLQFFYRVVGSAVQRNVMLTPPTLTIAGGGTYSLQLATTAHTVWWRLTTGQGQLVLSSTLDLGGNAAVDDCLQPSGECTFHVGQRSGGLHLANGCIFAATLHPSQIIR